MKASAVIGLLLGSFAYSYSEKPGHIEVKSTVSILKTVMEKGKEVQKLLPATKVLPNTVLFYTNTFTNISNKAADNVKLVNPIPKDTLYKKGSAKGANSDITFSIDGGEHWAKPELLTVLDNDGNAVPATEKDYTHIRWIYMKSLAPTEQQNTTFQATIL